MDIKTLQAEVHKLALEKGWWEGDNPNIPEKLALIHSEISEALEEFRAENGNRRSFTDYGNGKPEGYEVELADAIIRILDLCGYLGIDIERAISRKHDYNKTRPYKHGKRF